MTDAEILTKIKAAIQGVPPDRYGTAFRQVAKETGQKPERISQVFLDSIMGLA